MDLNALDPKAQYSSTGPARRRDGDGEGFRGVMELMAHLGTDRPRADEARRSAEFERPRAERVGGRSKPDDTRIDAHRAEARESREAQKAERRRSSDRADAQDVADAAPPAVPASTPAPTSLGTPSGGTAAAGTSPDASTRNAPHQETPAGVAPSQATPSQATPSQAAPGQATPGEANPTQAAAADAAPVDPGSGEAAATQTASSQAAPAQSVPVQAAVDAQPKPAVSTAAPATKPNAPANEAPAANRPAAAADATAANSAQAAAPKSTQAKADESRTGDGLRGAKVTVETAAATTRTPGVSSAVLMQAHMAATGDGAAKAGNATLSGAAGQTATHVGGGQPTFVGADAGGAQGGSGQGGDNSNGHSANGQAGNGQSGNGQSGSGQANGGPAQAGNGFTFGGATIGQRGFGGDAARAQFQDILATRTARAPSAAAAAQSASQFTAGPGGPQSTLPSAMASRAEATAQGRPGATPGAAVGQVAVKLVNTASDGGGQVTIRLNPEELGKVDVKLKLGHDGMVRATISAEKPETLEMLQRDARVLERALQDAGLKTDQQSLEFDLRGGNGQPTDRDQQELAFGAPSNETADTADPVESDATAGNASGGVREDGSYDLVA